MSGIDANSTPTIARSLYSSLGVVLTLLGLFGHILAARAIGGTALAFRDHLAGFFVIGIVSGLLIGGLGRLFWKRRLDVSILIFGAVQALLGLLVYLERFSVHG